MVVSKFPGPDGSKSRGKSPSDKGIEALLLKYVPFIKVAVEELLKRSGPVEILPAGWIGSMKVTGGEVPGIVLATRAGGEEFLFAGKDGRPLMWIEVGAFVVEPRVIMTADASAEGSKS